MNINKGLRKFSLILIFVVFVFACATNRAVTTADAGFAFSAKGTSYGIVLNFSNIPADTVSLSVFLFDLTKDAKIVHSVHFWDNEYWGFKMPINEIAELNQNQTLLFPFARVGHEYTVSVAFYSDRSLENMTEQSVSVVAGGGIFIMNNPSLNFTDENRYIILSEMPVFSQEIAFSEYRGLFTFGARMKFDEENSASVSGNWNDLSFPVIRFIETLNQSREYIEQFGITDTLPVIGFVETNITFGNLEWNIGITTSEEVFLTL